MTLAALPDSDAGLSDAALAATLFAVDPAGLGGVVLRNRPGPERDGWLARLRMLLPAGTPVGRAPLGIADDRLLGGLDLTASLTAGRPVLQQGLLAAHDGGVVLLPMAERIDEGTAARLCAVLDTGRVAVEREGLTAHLPAHLGVVLLDEGCEPDEQPPARLVERAAFPNVTAERADVEAPAGVDGDVIVAARETMAAGLPIPEAIVEALCAAAAAFGLDSMRPSLLALRAARAHAALRGRTIVTEEDAAVAVRLVLAPRALRLPPMEAEDDAPPPDAEDAEDAAEPLPSDDTAGAPGDDAAADRVLAAAQAMLPDGLLDRIVSDNRRAARSPRRSGAGAAAKSAKRGRPVGSRPGTLRPGDRLDLPATLRAAAPWARLRNGGELTGRTPVRATDFRIRRFVQRRESTTVFVVDASGSAAFQRLAEAKGAVELLLAKAYVSRARVALVAFRQTQAEVLLQPTRSLTRARLSLADLPGGGGTPLACGLEAGLALALAEKAKDRTPILVVLSDGRANIDRDGAPGREAADRDALAAARRIGEAGIDAAFLDTSPRPQPGGDRFARAMHGVYAPLPYADPERISAVAAGLSGRS